jgi:hypothetical protein
LKLIEPLCRRLGKRAEICVVEGGDHSFHMLKGAGKTDDAVLEDVAGKIAAWVARRLGIT